jgi:hypothetical protein
MMTIRHTLLALIFLGCTGLATAQESPFQNRTPNTLMASDGVPSPGATLQDVAWLSGHWTGTGLGGVTDENWSAPSAGAIMGMFRLVKDGKLIFYEFLTLVEHEGSLLLKLKHFNADLTGWEEKNDFVSFRLLKVTPNAMHFSGLTFRRVDDDTLEVFLAIRNKADGSVREERFEMKRAS